MKTPFEQYNMITTAFALLLGREKVFSCCLQTD